jgi:hypothetical protein
MQNGIMGADHGYWLMKRGLPKFSSPKWAYGAISAQKTGPYRNAAGRRKCTSESGGRLPARIFFEHSSVVADVRNTFDKMCLGVAVLRTEPANLGRGSG